MIHRKPKVSSDSSLVTAEVAQRRTFPNMIARSIESTDRAGSWSSRLRTASMSYSCEPWMKRIVLNRRRLWGESGRNEARKVRNEDAEVWVL